MAESTEDKAVDALIADLQSTLNKLKAAQRKDVDDEAGEEYDEAKPKNLQQAERKALTVRRQQSSDDKSEKSDTTK